MNADMVALLIAVPVGAGLLTAFIRAIDRYRHRQSSWPGRWRRVAARPVRWRHAIAMAGAGAWGYVLLSAAVQAGWVQPLGADARTDALSLGLQTLLLPAASLAALALCMGLERTSPRLAFGLGRRQRHCAARQAPLLYLAALPAVVATAVAWRGILDGLGVPSDPQTLVELVQSGRLSPQAVLYLSILAVTVAPVTEEVLFRGLLLPLLARHYGPGQAVVAVSLMFACVHFNAASLAPLFVIAAAFALAYLWTGSLLTPIVMHALFNGVNLLLLTTTG